MHRELLNKSWKQASSDFSYDAILLFFIIEFSFWTSGTGKSIGGIPAIDEEDAEYKLSLSPSELASLMDDEDYKAQKAINKEREEDEKAVSIDQ